jgi:hypothetical protein
LTITSASGGLAGLSGTIRFAGISGMSGSYSGVLTR